MATPDDGLAATWRKTNDTFLAPFVAVPNLGLAAVNGAVGAAARLTEQGVKATRGVFGTPGKLAERVSHRLADRGFRAANDSLGLVRKALDNATGQPADSGSNQLLSKTLLDKMTATAALPLFAGWETALAAQEDVPAVKEAAYDAWLALCKFLDTRSSHGVLTGDLRHDTDSLIRFGFYYMTTQGPLEAVARDFRGMVGGVLALGLGDFEWLAKAARDYWVSMEYVYDKWLAGETKPEWDFPIGPVLAQDGKAIIKRFPRPFVRALESGDPKRVLDALVDDAGEIFTMLSRYPSTAFRVVYDVMVFVSYAWVQVSDSLDYTLCELAIVESEMADEEKLESMERLRKTAGNATIEFEYYVPLLVSFEGTPADQVHRKNAVGEEINHHTIAKSVFQQRAIDRAQAITAELMQLRAFLWLFRDETVARQKSHQETARKFGDKAAERIAAEPLYPLSQDEMAKLMAPDGEHPDAPRPPEQVKEILYQCLRRRGLLYIADRAFENEPFVTCRQQRLSADYRPAEACR